MKKKQSNDLVSNRKAFHSYEILETFEAGIELKGTEVKSLKDNGGSLSEAYVKIERGEVFLIGCHIAPWHFGNIHNHPERRERKLLLHKQEIQRLKSRVQEKGFTIIPLSMYVKKGRIKITIALGKGKSAVDKRHSIKEKEEKVRMQRAMKNFS